MSITSIMLVYLVVLTIPLICVMGIPIGVSEDESQSAVRKTRSSKPGGTWHYGQAGPEEWHLSYPKCGGRMQSPINIDTEDVTFGKLLQPFDFSNYTTEHQGENVTLLNKAGHTVELDYNGTPIYLAGGSLPDQYILDQFHFHWGSGDQNGSEHTLDGRHFPMEMHLVHHQAHLNATEAMSSPFGLAVIAYFIQVGEANEAFDQLLGHFHQVHEENKKTSFPFLPLRQLLPRGENHYYRYDGSLTTPPCYESVIWSIAKEHITISSQQVSRFQDFINKANRTIRNNFRPTQPTHFRQVLSSWDPNPSDASDCFSGAEKSTPVVSLLMAMTALLLRHWI